MTSPLPPDRLFLQETVYIAFKEVMNTLGSTIASGRQWYVLFEPPGTKNPVLATHSHLPSISPPEGLDPYQLLSRATEGWSKGGPSKPEMKAQRQQEAALGFRVMSVFRERDYVRGSQWGFSTKESKGPKV